MPGFFVSNKNIDIELKNRYSESCIAESISSTTGTFKRNTLDKFMNDKTLANVSDITIILDGYLLNKKELFQNYHVNSIEELILKMYHTCGETFFSNFRGAFSGALFDKSSDKWIVYTNHIGDAAVFFYKTNDSFFAGSQVNYVIDAARAQNLPLTFHELAAYQMLTYAFMIDDSTYAKEIKRLRGGTYLCVENGHAEVKEYHTFTQNPERFANYSENNLIKIINQQFQEAVRVEYEKDSEYQYEHLSDLSGGLDSRMNIWVAHAACGIDHIQCLTYCKANYLDELIAKEISEYWKDELLVKPLDDISFLYDIDENIFLTGGLSLYSGITGGKRMLESINMSRYGLEHTGQVGDAILGSFFSTPIEQEQRKPSGMYSEVFSNRISDFTSREVQKYKSYEIYLMYARGFQGAANTHQIRRNYTEVASPFLYVDFLQTCLDIPTELRIKHHLYKKWILSCYPDAAKFTWEKTGNKITESSSTTFLKKVITHGPRACVNRISKIFGYKPISKSGMNPLDYWISQDQKLRSFWSQYVEETLQQFSSLFSSQLKLDIQHLFYNGNASEQVMALTVLGALKLYFGK